MGAPTGRTSASGTSPRELPVTETPTPSTTDTPPAGTVMAKAVRRVLLPALRLLTLAGAGGGAEALVTWLFQR